MTDNIVNGISHQTIIKYYAQWLFYIILLIIALYFSTTRFWEPGSETWRQWAFARILRETGGFPSFSGSPLYVLYLQIFSPFQFPLNFQIEYWITQFFCVLSIFLLLSRFIPRCYAILLTIAWIPMLGIVEGSHTVAAIGFVAIYFIIENSSYRKFEYFSTALLAASLCNGVFVLFAIAHGIGEIIRRRVTKTPFFSFERIEGFKKIPWFKILLIIIIALTVFFQSPRWDNNANMMDPKYVPIPLNSNLDILFFQEADNQYMMKTYPPSEWVFQDWYFTHKDAFGDSQTLIQAFITKPQFSSSFIRDKIPYSLFLGTFLIFGKNFVGLLLGDLYLPIMLSIISWTLLFLGIISIVSQKKSDKIPLIIMICLGSIGLICIFLIGGFRLRYMIFLLPTGLFLLVNSQIGAEVVINQIYKRIARSLIPNINAIVQLYINNRKFIFHAFIAILSLTIIFSNIYCTPYNIRENLYPDHLLSGQKPSSLVENYNKLFGSINPQSRLLTCEPDIWVKAFGPIDIDNIVNIWSIPPFKDKTDQTNNLLNSLDVIWIDNFYASPHTDQSTNSYVRYLYNIKPHLEAGMKSGEWTTQEIEGYGRIYYHMNKSYLV